MRVVLQSWTEPVPMDTGAPEPIIVVDADTVWLAYRAHDPDVPGWGHHDADTYMALHPNREPFGVLRFDDVAQHDLGAPSEDRLRDHPLWNKGLNYYSFHMLEAVDGRTRWLVTFHDETFDVTARAAEASPLIFASDHLAAIDKVRRAR